jgi:NADH:ubiquinone oxidoreductase subunit 2 (subunit N)
MWTFMLGFIGFPLTGGFWGKFLVFRAAYDRGWVWLMIVGVVATLVSVPYYLAVLRAMYLRSGAELRLSRTTPVAAGGSPPREGWLTSAVIGALGVTIASFFAVQPLIDGARDAANALPF